MWGLVSGAVCVILAATQLCQPSECLARLRSLGPVEVVVVAPAGLAGAWSEGPGLAGSELYLFSDHTYLYTRWADVLPETVYDKGKWAVAEGLLTLTPDQDVVWDRQIDRRFFVLRVPRRNEAVLFGLDRHLPMLEGLVEAAPETPADEWLSVSGMRSRGPWPRGTEAQAKAEILKRAWKPDYFAQ